MIYRDKNQPSINAGKYGLTIKNQPSIKINQKNQPFSPMDPSWDMQNSSLSACSRPTNDPRDWDWDELDLQYAQASEESLWGHAVYQNWVSLVYMGDMSAIIIIICILS